MEMVAEYTDLNTGETYEKKRKEVQSSTYGTSTQALKN